MTEKFDLHALEDYTVALRREFHKHPELSMEEEWTYRRICRELETLKIPYVTVGDKNVIGKLDLGPGRRLAIRADFDALPLEEEVDVPWRSEIPGAMHACGHDGHTAVLLGTAKGLLSMRERLTGTVYLCFQQGEEIGQGADRCVEYLLEQGGVDWAIGAHLMSILETGTIDLSPGFRAAGASLFSIDISGRGGHGSRPDLSNWVPAILCDIYQHLVAIPSNRLEAARTSVISPCVLRAGTKVNVLPETARMEGTIRFTGMEDGKTLMDLVRQTADQVAAIYGGKAETAFRLASQYPIVNDPETVAAGRRAAEMCGLKLVDIPPATASDNFSEFLHAFPGFFCFIGSHSNRPGTSGIHHAPDFDLDERALSHAVAFFLRCALEFLGQ